MKRMIVLLLCFLLASGWIKFMNLLCRPSRVVSKSIRRWITKLIAKATMRLQQISGMRLADISEHFANVVIPAKR